MKDLLLPLLRKAQEKEGCVSEDSVKRISRKTGLPASQVYGAMTFYSMLHTRKQGRNIIEICNSPSCYLNGSLNIIKFIEKKLGIKSGQTTKDMKFSLHICSCMGCCYKPPSMRLNGKVYGKLTKKRIEEILNGCR